MHPECNADIVKIADYIGSTSGIINYAKEHIQDKEFIIGTVVGVDYKLKEVRPDARFYYPKTIPVCPNMLKINLENVYHVLVTDDHAVALPTKDIVNKAKSTLERMLELAK